MKLVEIVESDKYFTNMLFVLGFAFLSFFGSVVLEAVKEGGFEFFNFFRLGLTALALFLGFVFILTGWFIIGRREERA